MRRARYPRGMTLERIRRIAIADDSPAFVAAAADYITSLPGYGLAGTVQAVSQAVTLVENALPDVLLLGLGLSPGRGLDMVRRVKACTCLHAPHHVETAARRQAQAEQEHIGKRIFDQGHRLRNRLHRAGQSVARQARDVVGRGGNKCRAVIGDRDAPDTL